MRKAIIKKIACILSFFLITGSFGSSVYSDADNTQKDSSIMISSKLITLRYFCSLPNNTAEGISNLSELDFYKDLERETNIKISFIHPTVDSQLNKYMLMMAAGDLPDIVELPWTKYPSILDKSVEYGAIHKLDSLIEKNAPYLNEILKSDKNLKRQITSDDGSIYQFPSLNPEESSEVYQPLIRKDFLDKIGLSMPQTIDEWEVVLKNFKEQKLTKSPISFDIKTLDTSNSFIGAFGITRDFYIKDGRVAFGPIEKSYKELLTTFSRWYRNGLLDPEFIILKNAQIKNKVNKGQVGAFIGTKSDLESASSALKAINDSYELVPVQNPVLSMEDKLKIPAKSEEANLTGSVVITRMNKYPIETMKWLDYAYSKSIKSYNKGQVQNNAEDLEILSLQGTRNKLMPPVSLTQKENEEVSMIMRDINTYCSEMFAKFVLGVEPLENFDKYVDKVRMIGIERVIQIKKAALYRFNNRLTDDRIRVNINGNPLDMDTNPIIVNDKPIVPVRFVIEALGGSVTWNEEDKSVTVFKDNIKIILNINNANVLVNRENIALNTEVFLLNDRTYVPADFLSQTLGIELNWDEQARKVSIGDSQLSLKSYFPQEKKLFKYSGGFEGGGYSRKTVMTGEGKVQIYEISTAANVAKVYTVNEHEISLVLFIEEYNKDISYLDAEHDRNEVILKAPIKIGTAWTNEEGRSSTITGVNVDISTPAGSFNTIEVTTKINNAVIKEYYSQNVGLVKSVYKADEFEMLSELIRIESLQ